MKILLVAINAKYIHSNLAVYSLKAFSKRSDEEVSVCEFTINNLIDEILDEIYLKKPDILAFSCYIWNIEYVRKLITEVKKMLPKVRIWLGGPEAYYNSKALLNECKEIDIIIKGEGEITFKELCDFYIENEKYILDINHADNESICVSDENDRILNERVHISNEKNRTLNESIHVSNENNGMLNERVHKLSNDIEDRYLKNILGIDFRSRAGEIIENLHREPVDMSIIPFPYDNIEDFDNKIIYYESSRGCPFSCSYCLSSVEKKLRFRDKESVKEELKFFLDNKVKQVKFVDRTFNCNRNHALDIWNFICENDNGITNFHFEIAADLIDEEELLLISKMRSGLIQLEIGVQSTNNETIREIHRTMKLDRLKYIVDKINSFKNVHQHLDLIAGLPCENLDSFINSFNEVYAMKPKELQLGFLKVLKGSYMYENRDKYGIVYKSYPPYEVISTKWMSYEDILLLKGVEEMVEEYYNSGQFTLALNYLQKYFETPFKLFYELSRYYEEHFDKSAKHSRITRYKILIDFMKKLVLGKEEYNNIICNLKMLLTFDIYLRENAKSRPDFANDNGIYREEIKCVAKAYGLKREEHIEVLTGEEYNILDLELFSNAEFIENNVENDIIENTSDKKNTKKYFIVFDYDYRNPITNQCKIKILNI